MFEVGFTELLLISALALLVLGPQKLPKLAQQIGRWVGRARAMARQFRDQLEEEAHSLETKMNVDPGIDTSLEPRRAPTPPTSTGPAPYSPPSIPAPPAAPPVPPQYSNDVEEEFYPPDHHMHPSHQSGPAPSAPEVEPGAGSQGELDLTNKPGTRTP